MSKLIGIGKNSKKRRIARSLIKTSKSKSSNARTSSLIKKSWKTNSRRPLSKRTSTTSSRCNWWIIISMTWFGAWRNSSLIWGLTTPPSFTRLSRSSSVSGLRYSSKMRKKLSTFLPTIKRLKKSFWKWKRSRKRPNQRTWRIKNLKTRTIKLSRRLSLKKKCKFLRNVWRTWKLSTAWMRKNSILTLKCFKSVLQLTKRLRTFWKFAKESSVRSSVKSSATTTPSWLASKGITLRTPTNSKFSPNSSRNSKRNSNGLKSQIITVLKRSGKWTKKRQKQSSRRLCTLTKLSINSSSTSPGNHPVIQSSGLWARHRMAQQLTTVSKELILQPKAAKFTSKLSTSQITNIRSLNLISKMVALLTRVNTPPTRRTMLTKPWNSSASRMSSKCWLMNVSTLSTIEHSRDAKVPPWRSNSQSRSTVFANRWVSRIWRMCSYSLTFSIRSRPSTKSKTKRSMPKKWLNSKPSQLSREPHYPLFLITAWKTWAKLTWRTRRETPLRWIWTPITW